MLFGDVSRDNFKHQYELVRHTGIAQGDAAKTKEGEAPADEQNEFDTIALAGEEIKKTAKPVSYTHLDVYKRQVGRGVRLYRRRRLRAHSHRMRN